MTEIFAVLFSVHNACQIFSGARRNKKPRAGKHIVFKIIPVNSMNQSKFKFLLLTILTLSVLPFVGCGGSGGESGSARTNGTIELGWVPNQEPDLAGYRIYYGIGSGDYDHSMDVGMPSPLGNLTTYSLANLVKGQNYCFVITAYDSSNNESGFSEEICATAW
jgi:hypothetical protein